jgi:rod shape-determining protein MreC
MFLSSKKRKNRSLFSKHEINLNLLIVLLIVNFSVYSSNQDNSFLNSIKRSLQLAPQSISLIFEFGKDLINDVSSYFAFKQNLLNENENLQKENAELKAYVMQMADIESENLELNNKLNIQKKYFKDSVVTQILNLNYQGQNHHFLVDKGETDGVYIGQIVVDKSGIVGQVIEVNNASSVIRTILSNELYLTGYIKSGKTIYQSLIRGDGRNLVINYFNKTNNIKLGDELFTTGDNLNIPKGLRIGKVKKFLNTDLNDFYKLVIEPSSNPYKERFLVIVK